MARESKCCRYYKFYSDDWSSLDSMYCLDRKGVTQMTSKRIVGLVLLIVGIVVLILAVAADTIGLGTSAGFGTRHIVGTVVGVVVTAVGAFLVSRK